MALVASIHALGLLVVDEIQHVSVAKSGGAEKLLNFFVQLTNEVGVPIIMIGTFKAMGVLCSEFRQIRRGCSQGDMIWTRMVRGGFLRRPDSKLARLLWSQERGVAARRDARLSSAAKPEQSR
jgi:hypothetical protein